MLNYYEGMERDDYEDYEITWKDADDIELRKSRIQSIYTYNMSSTTA